MLRFFASTYRTTKHKTYALPVRFAQLAFIYSFFGFSFRYRTKNNNNNTTNNDICILVCVCLYVACNDAVNKVGMHFASVDHWQVFDSFLFFIDCIEHLTINK